MKSFRKFFKELNWIEQIATVGITSVAILGIILVILHMIDMVVVAATILMH